MNKVTLIYIECSIFNGIARVLINDTVFSFALGTPNYNDYGEYRIDTLDNKAMSLEQYKEKFPHQLMDYVICEIPDEALPFWERFKLRTQQAWEDDTQILTDADCRFIDVADEDGDRVTCGHSKEQGFVIWHNGGWKPYEELKPTLNPYTSVMYPFAEVFFKWQREELKLEFDPRSGADLLIYPD